MSSNTLLITVQQIKDRTGLHSNVDEKLVKPDIKYCQDAYILPLLGTALMAKMQNGIENNNLSGDYLSLYNTYLIDALAYYTLSESPMMISYQIYNKGVIRKTSDDTVTPDVQELISVADKYKRRAEYYGQRMADYLLQNNALFVEYRQPGTGFDTFIPDTKSYETTFDLDGDCKCTDGSFLPVSDSNFKNGCK